MSETSVLAMLGTAQASAPHTMGNDDAIGVLTMATAPRPQVTPLEEGEVFDTKRMEAVEGVQWPRHRASTESVLVVTEGQLIVEFPDAQPTLAAGESIVIPADVYHQIVPNPAFQATHIMPKDIRFIFSS